VILHANTSTAEAQRNAEVTQRRVRRLSAGNLLDILTSLPLLKREGFIAFGCFTSLRFGFDL